MIAGFLLQASALGHGQLSVVEPILVLELPVTLVLAAVVFHADLRRREWGSIVAMTVGLAGLLYALSPSPGQTRDLPWYTWLTGICVNAAVVGVVVFFGRRSDTARRAALLGVASGSTFGLTAALMEGMTNTFARGFLVMLMSWQLYGVIAAGLLAMFLLQSALQAGRLITAQPGITLSDPLVSILWGVIAFREQVRGGFFILAAVLAGGVMAAAAVVLTRSPLLHGGDDREECGRTGGRRRGAVA